MKFLQNINSQGFSDVSFSVNNNKFFFNGDSFIKNNKINLLNLRNFNTTAVINSNKDTEVFTNINDDSQLKTRLVNLKKNFSDTMDELDKNDLLNSSPDLDTLKKGLEELKELIFETKESPDVDSQLYLDEKYFSNTSFSEAFPNYYKASSLTVLKSLLPYIM